MEAIVKWNISARFVGKYFLNGLSWGGNRSKIYFYFHALWIASWWMELSDPIEVHREKENIFQNWHLGALHTWTFKSFRFICLISVTFQIRFKLNLPRKTLLRSVGKLQSICLLFSSNQTSSKIFQSIFLFLL